MGKTDTPPTRVARAEQTLPTEAPPPLSPRRDGARTRVPTPLAVTTAVLVVALLAAVFAMLAHNRAPHTGASATATTTVLTTATPTATPTTPTVLVARAPITNLPGTPVVAPSDPRVMYEYADNEPGVVLRHSEDGGATWGEFLLPNFSGSIGAVELAVNPADAQNIFLRLTLGYFPGQANPCGPAAGPRAALSVAGVVQLNAALPGSGGSDCTNVYTSRDAGASWTLVRLPVAGSLFQTGVTFSSDATAFQAQQSTLYGRVWQLNASGSQTGDIRIVRTDDEGLSWRAADAALSARAGHLCAFSATPAGATLFAIASTANCWSWTHGTRTIWRSDDGGATWIQAGSLPAVVAQPGIILMAAGSSSSAVVYALPQQPVDWGVAGVRQIQASEDGGRTWTASAPAGLPAGVQPLLAASTPLPDGSLVVALATGISGTPHGLGSVSCFAWSPAVGTWRRVTPAVNVTSTQLANLYVSTSRPLTVTLSVETGSDPTDPTYTLVPFARP
jgi:hypothetical protein